MKYELGQLIYYMLDNKVHSAKVLARKQVENAKDYNELGTEEMAFDAPWGDAGIWYKTCHCAIDQNDAFASREELLESL